MVMLALELMLAPELALALARWILPLVRAAAGSSTDNGSGDPEELALTLALKMGRMLQSLLLAAGPS